MSPEAQTIITQALRDSLSRIEENAAAALQAKQWDKLQGAAAAGAATERVLAEVMGTDKLAGIDKCGYREEGVYRFWQCVEPQKHGGPYACRSRVRSG